MTKYKFSDEVFTEAVKISFSIRETLLRLGVAPFGGSYKFFKLRVDRLNIDLSHFTGQAHLKGKTHHWCKKIPLLEVLVPNSTRALNSNFRKRLLSEGLLKEKCSKCGLENEWQGAHLTLHVDHINGDHFDHRLENLRLLCPNCHSQTDTYGSKNKTKNKSTTGKSEFIPQPKLPTLCKICGKILKDKNREHCCQCYAKHRKELQLQNRKYKIIWLPIEVLLKKLETTSYVALGKELGISDNAIRKHIRNYKKNDFQ